MQSNQSEPSLHSKDQIRIPRFRAGLLTILTVFVIAVTAWSTWKLARPSSGPLVQTPLLQKTGAPSPLFNDPLAIRDLQDKAAADPNRREWLDRLAVAYVQETHYLSAIEVLNRLVQQPGPQPDARRGLVHCYNQIECYESALPHLLALLALEPQSLDLHLELADQYRLLGIPQRGVKVLDDIPRNGVGYPMLGDSRNRAADLERLAMVYGELGEWEKCRQLAHTLVTDAPTRLSAHLVYGKALFSLGRLREAVPYLRKGLGAAPDDPDLQLLLTSAVQSAGRAEDRRELKRLLLHVSAGKEAPGWSWYELGLLYRQEKDWSGAAHSFRSACDLSWERTASLKYLGEALGKLGRVEESLYRTGLYYEAVGQPEKALAAYQKMSGMHPDNIYGKLHIARAYGLMGQRRKQEAVLLQAWKQDRSEPGLLVDLAHCYEGLKEFDREMQVWEQFLQADPSRAKEAYERLGTLADSRGQLDEAEQWYRKCVELDPASAPYKLQLARLLLERRTAQKKLVEAIQLLEEALPHSRSSSELFSQLGLAYLYTQRWEEAILALRHAIDLEPGNRKPYFQLSQLLVQAGKRNEGEWAQAMHRRWRAERERENTLLERLHRTPDDIATRTQLASLYEATAAQDKAVREYETILTTSPNNRDARRRLSLLYLQLGRYDKQAPLASGS